MHHFDVAAAKYEGHFKNFTRGCFVLQTLHIKLFLFNKLKVSSSSFEPDVSTADCCFHGDFTPRSNSAVMTARQRPSLDFKQEILCETAKVTNTSVCVKDRPAVAISHLLQDPEDHRAGPAASLPGESYTD